MKVKPFCAGCGFDLDYHSCTCEPNPECECEMCTINKESSKMEEKLKVEFERLYNSKYGYTWESNASGIFKSGSSFARKLIIDELISLIRAEFRKTWHQTYHHFGIVDGYMKALYSITKNKAFIETTIREESDLDKLLIKLEKNESC